MDIKYLDSHYVTTWLGSSENSKRAIVITFDKNGFYGCWPGGLEKSKLIQSVLMKPGKYRFVTHDCITPGGNLNQATYCLLTNLEPTPTPAEWLPTPVEWLWDAPDGVEVALVEVEEHKGVFSHNTPMTFPLSDTRRIVFRLLPNIDVEINSGSVEMEIIPRSSKAQKLEVS